MYLFSILFYFRCKGSLLAEALALQRRYAALRELGQWNWFWVCCAAHRGSYSGVQVLVECDGGCGWCWIVRLGVASRFAACLDEVLFG